MSLGGGPTSIMTWWYYCEIMPCLNRYQAPHRRHPEHLDTGAASQWPAAARIVSGSGYLAAASSHPHYKYTASDHDINQIRRVNNNGDRCRKLESVLSLSSQFTYFPDTWPRLSDTSWHWGTEGSRDPADGITSTGQCCHDPVGGHFPGCELWTLNSGC